MPWPRKRRNIFLQKMGRRKRKKTTAHLFSIIKGLKQLRTGKAANTTQAEQQRGVKVEAVRKPSQKRKM